MGLVAMFLGKLFPAAKRAVPAELYDLTINDIDGKPVDFQRYRGKNLLIVNTASRCGYTPQYADLQKLHELYGDKIEVLGFPANNFLWQEPGTNAQIAEFCDENYGVTFQMFEKISVRGSGQHPLYQWLEARSGKTPTWNFCKYVVNSQGEVVGFYGPKVNPLDESILNHITP